VVSLRLFVGSRGSVGCTVDQPKRELILSLTDEVADDAEHLAGSSSVALVVELGSVERACTTKTGCQRAPRNGSSGAQGSRGDRAYRQGTSSWQPGPTRRERGEQRQRWHA
jgi:hypothetical protein